MKYRLSEHFQVDAMINEWRRDTEERGIPENMEAMIKKYNITPTEVFQVIDKFDLPPSSLSESEKQLRVKYLDVVSKVVTDGSEKARTFFGMGRNSNGLVKYFLSENFDSSKMLGMRLIDLLKAEVNPKKCPACPKCPACVKEEPPSTMPYLACIGFLAILVVVLLVVKV